LIATAQNKISGTGAGVAAGTLAANANRVYLIDSQRDLAATFGNPFFYKTTAGTPINGYELNEYGLLAAYSALGVTNRAYVQRVDIDLVQLGRGVNGATIGTNDYATSSSTTNAFIGSTGATVYNSASSNAAALGEAGIRRSIQRLDDQDVPMTDRFLIVPPSSRNTLMSISRFTEQAFVGEQGGNNTIRNGQIGDVFGVKVFVSTNADTAAGTSGTDRICLLAHKDAFVLAEQMGVRSQTQYKQEYLGTLFTSDMLYGVAELRDGSAVALAVPA
jgi:hypothetical protein